MTLPPLYNRGRYLQALQYCGNSLIKLLKKEIMDALPGELKKMQLNAGDGK